MEITLENDLMKGCASVKAIINQAALIFIGLPTPLVKVAAVLRSAQGKSFRRFIKT
jgi:hypothetical protein